MSNRSPHQSNRREFLQTSAAAAGAVAATFAVPRAVHAGTDDTIRVGLIGCGGRGSGAAKDALRADKRVKLVAMGDAFEDQLQTGLELVLKHKPVVAQVDVPKEKQFVGFDAYKKVIDSGVDLVILAEPPHFRPEHLKYAVAADKHVFCEKPVAVDAPGIRSVMETVAEAKRKKLSLVSGLCYRYHGPKLELYKRIHDGAIGDISAMHVSYNTGGLIRDKDRKPEWSDMEFQLRNWYYYTWLSGDFIVEQHVHSLDKAAWAMRDETPVSASGMGGRQVRTEAKYGQIFDHHAVVFEYKNGQRLFSYCRQQPGTELNVSDRLIGSKGAAEVMKHEIKGATENWSFPMRDLKKYDMYLQEHQALNKSIRDGQGLNNGDYMCSSSMMAILGRMATYTGQSITWERAMNSKENFTPKEYTWGPLPMPTVAKPGITQFV